MTIIGEKGATTFGHKKLAQCKDMARGVCSFKLLIVEGDQVGRVKVIHEI